MTRVPGSDPPSSPQPVFEFLDRPAAELAAPLLAAHAMAGQVVRPGEVLGPYRVIREVGHGGMAAVYLAEDPRHGRQVALKIVYGEIAASISRQRFLQEIQVAARLLHPHILPVFDSGESDGRLWYAMPYVAGESLRQRLAREPQLPIAEAVRIAGEVALALDYAHREGIVHRDIKPANILLADGQALVADFGIARALRPDRPPESPPDKGLTETGVAIGTPAYMSPEQALGTSDVDARTDIHALGCVLYEVLAGEPPYTGLTAQAILARHFTGDVPSVRQRRPEVPETIELAITKALAPAPRDRFVTAAEFARALVAPATVHAVTTSAKQPPRAERPPAGSLARSPAWRRTIPLALALGLGCVVAVGVFYARGHTRSSGVADVREPRRLAVLPFESVGDTNDRAFADGMSEELTTRLARVPGLSLVARSSARQYRGSGQTAPAFGRALQVDYVLDGTVRSAVSPGGQRQVRITPELIRVADGTHVWGEPYEAVLADVFRLQADVAGQVAEALRGTLGGGVQRAVARAPTADLEAYRLYVLGRAEWNRRSPESLEQAAEYFRQALGRDSTFARAWAGLADVYALYDYYHVGSVPRDTAYARARAAALRAIALDSTLAEPHASLNQILRYGYWDWAGSEREVRRAIALDPSYATAHQWLAEHLLATWRLPEALVEARTAVQLDPLARPPTNILGMALWSAGRPGEAVAVFRGGLARDSSPGPLAHNLFFLYLASDRSDDALALLETLHDTSTIVRAIARGRHDSAARTTALAGLQAARQLHLPGGTHVELSRGYAVMGEPEAALSELEQAAAEREPGLEFIKAEPTWASLHTDPRFPTIVARVGLPP